MDAWSTHSSRHIGLYIAEEPATYDDQRRTLYLDTSVVSYLTARPSREFSIARRQRLTRIWWNRYRRHYLLQISAPMVEEAERGSLSAAAERLNAIAGIAILDFDTASKRLADKLVGAGRLPENARADAAHVAISATNSIPLLLTWNYRHLANPVIQRKLVQTCESEGFRCPEICTPEHLMRTYRYARSTSSSAPTCSRATVSEDGAQP